MIVVSDTSPISALLQVGKAGMLERLFGNVVVPAAVYDELAVCHADLPDWVHRVEVQNLSAVQSLLLHLDRGESEAIVLAGELGADFLLMDEKAGREIARQQGRHTIGILGAALLAKRRGILGCTMVELIFNLRSTAGFRISKELEDHVVASAGE